MDLDGRRAIEPVIGDTPQSVLPVEQQAVHLVGTEPVADRNARKPSPVRRMLGSLVQQPRHAGAVGGDPEPLQAVFGHVVDERVLETLAPAVVGEAVPVEAAQSFEGGDPDVSV